MKKYKEGNGEQALIFQILYCFQVDSLNLLNILYRGLWKYI